MPFLHRFHSKLRLISKKSAPADFKKFQKNAALSLLYCFFFFLFLGVSFCGFGGFRVYLFMSRERQI